MRTIRVDPYFYDVPVFDSPSEAISAEVRTLRAKRSAIDSARVSGQRLTRFSVSDQGCTLILSNGLSLEIALVDNQVEWRIEEIDAASMNPAQHDYAPSRLLWPSGADTLFDPVALLAARLSLPLHKVFVGQYFVNVYFKAGGVLQFDRLWNQSDLAPLLNVTELELVGAGRRNG